MGFDTILLGWPRWSSFVPKRKLCDLQENILQYWSSPKSSSIGRVKQVEGQFRLYLTSIYICNAFKDKGTVVCYFSDPFLHSTSKKGLSDGRRNNSQPFSWSYRGLLSSIWMSSDWWTSLRSSAENPRVDSAAIMLVLRLGHYSMIYWDFSLRSAFPSEGKMIFFLSWNKSFNLE